MWWREISGLDGRCFYEFPGYRQQRTRTWAYCFQALEGDQCLVWAFDFVFGLEEFFTPWFTCALGAFVNGIANSETVIAGPFGAGARKLLTRLARLEELAF